MTLPQDPRGWKITRDDEGNWLPRRLDDTDELGAYPSKVAAVVAIADHLGVEPETLDPLLAEPQPNTL